MTRGMYEDSVNVDLTAGTKLNQKIIREPKWTNPTN